MRGRKWPLIMALVLAIGASITFYSTRASLGVPPDDIVSENSSGAGKDEAATNMETPVIQTDEARVTVTMIIDPEKQTPDDVVVSIYLDTHYVDLGSFDIAEAVMVEAGSDARGLEQQQGIRFESASPSDSHHRSGQLLISRAENGQTWLTQETGILRISMDGVPKGTSRMFEWTKPWQWARYNR